MSDGPLADLSTTDFTRAEMRAAQWLNVKTDWHWGYPQPDEGSFGYRHVTYDDSAACPKCWVGLRQIAPFQLIAEPKWGRRNVLQLNWVFDELFVTPEVWESVFRDFGVAARVVHDRKGAELSTVVQLVVDEVVDLDMDRFDFHLCEHCGVRKYSAVTRGFHPRPLYKPDAEVCRSSEWFGSGARSYRALLVSQGLFAAIENAKAKGTRFVPCAPTVLEF